MTEVPGSMLAGVKFYFFLLSRAKTLMPTLPFLPNLLKPCLLGLLHLENVSVTTTR